ncbi:hypothetical protein VHEMI06218 [[Torrubiella] hemipterigena]|uniref:Allergen Asp f 4 n=1 Tax=[Torrubiella] hemipterigena TaxID=1531966 RepID=A0A0A1TIJ4_9HYPO|nr:hypothetical protein VHEMI06218 [[Torrubiella] hemipterigena]
MKFSTIVLAAAVGVSAHPSAHGHRQAHRSVEARAEKFVMNKKPAPPPAPTPKEEPKPVATPSPAPAPAPAKPSPVAQAAAAVGNAVGTGLSSYAPFCGGQKRATVAQIGYKGNTGINNNACNVMAIKSNIADKYKYVLEFNNKGADSTCACWNKIGHNGGINGFFKGNEALTFSIASGSTQFIAVDANSQGACGCSIGGSVGLTSFGQFAGTWAEFDFENQSNNGWSGADISCLVAAKYGLAIPAMKVCATSGGPCSTIFAGGAGDNAYTGGTEDLDGVGLNLAPGPVHLKVTLN